MGFPEAAHAIGSEEILISLEPFFSAFLELYLLYKNYLNLQNQKGGNTC